ncbi:LIC12162 family transferase [Campylobacter sp.]|uniref:LIC12162 family transferase n=1 Tax=Campylobacter sp. TaxID=205 RepID=UPI003FA12007
MMSNNGTFLCTTALMDTWDTRADKLLFLGEHCKLFDKKEYYEKLNYQVFKYIWSDKAEVNNALMYCTSVFDDIIEKLTELLNRYHGVNYSKKYWQDLLIPWLQYYILTIYDRYMHIKMAYADCKNLYTNILIEDNFSFIATTKDFLEYAHSDDCFNLQLYSQVVKFLNLKHNIINIDSPKIQTKIEINNKKSIIKKTLSVISGIINILNFNKKVVMVSPYFKFNAIRHCLKLFVYSKFRIVFDNMNYHILVDVKPNLNIRKNLFKNIGFMDEFKNFLFYSFVQNFPIIYLEAYKDFDKKIDELKLKPPKVVYSANALYHNEIFRFFYAKYRKDVVVTYGQHGGDFGIDKIDVQEEIESKFCDIYYTYGWKKQEVLCSVLPQQPLPICSANNKINLIMTCMPRYLCCIGYIEDGAKMLRYIENTKVFLNKLKYDNLLNIRTYNGDYGWSVKNRLLECGKKLFFNSKINYYKQISSSRLNVFDHMHTGYLESLSLNKPTIIFIAKGVYSFREEVKPHIKDLIDAKILFIGAEECAEFINKNYDEIELWWNTNKVQNAKNLFLHKYFRTSTNWVQEWVKEFDMLLENRWTNKV